MNDLQRARLEQHVDPDHECTPYDGGCHMPHYWYHRSLPRYVAAWPETSQGRDQADLVREERDWSRSE